MECPNIGEIKLSNRSIEAIDEIRRVRQVADTLAVALSAGIVANIFVGNGLLEASYTLYDTDFEQFAKSMKGIPAIAKKRVKDEADRAWLDVSNYKEKQFWRAISSGCEIH